MQFKGYQFYQTVSEHIFVGKRKRLSKPLVQDVNLTSGS
jgi:hypothetical protein